MSTTEKIKYTAMPLRIPRPMTVMEYAVMEQEMFNGVMNKLSRLSNADHILPRLLDCGILRMPHE